MECIRKLFEVEILGGQQRCPGGRSSWEEFRAHRWDSSREWAAFSGVRALGPWGGDCCWTGVWSPSTCQGSRLSRVVKSASLVTHPELVQCHLKVGLQQSCKHDTKRKGNYTCVEQIAQLAGRTASRTRPTRRKVCVFCCNRPLATLAAARRGLHISIPARFFFFSNVLSQRDSEM